MKNEQKRKNISKVQNKTRLHIFIDEQGNVTFSDLPIELIDLVQELNNETENLFCIAEPVAEKKNIKSK